MMQQQRESDVRARMPTHAAQCTIKFTYSQLWAVTELMPVVVISVLACVLGAITLARGAHAGVTTCRGRLRGGATTAWRVLHVMGAEARTATGDGADALVGGTFTLLYYTYFITTTRALEVFRCSHVAGHWVLDAEPSMRCWEGDQAALVPYAAAALAVYGVGTPVAFAIVFRRHWFAIRRDQRLWLLGKGNSAAENRDFGVRRRYARLYQVRYARRAVHEFCAGFVFTHWTLTMALCAGLLTALVLVAARAHGPQAVPAARGALPARQQHVSDLASGRRLACRLLLAAAHGAVCVRE
jgi:hypothetical protein